MADDRLLSVPNILTVSRIPLTVLLCAFIDRGYWSAALITFAVASVTDWIDGWWARKYDQQSTFGRVFDPLTDKILLGSAFIFLIKVYDAALDPWMVAVIIGRELLITGVRGYVESLGKKFGADWFGKLKTVLQCIWLLVVLFFLAMKFHARDSQLLPALEVLHYGLLYAMLAATVLSGAQYIGKAYQLLYGRAAEASRGA